MSRESGASTVLLLAVMAIVATLSVATAGLGLALAARAKAQNAADASALAAAVATYPPVSPGVPHTAAREVALANGAALVLCRCAVDSSLRAREVTVVAAVPVSIPILGDLTVRASSSAEFEPMRWLGVPPLER